MFYKRIVFIHYILQLYINNKSKNCKVHCSLFVISNGCGYYKFSKPETVSIL